MKKYFFLIGIFMVFGNAQDSLPWKGTIVWDTVWVRVDDADSLFGPPPHRAIHPQTILDEKNLILYTVWEDDRDNDNNHEIYFAFSEDTAKSWNWPNVDLSQSPSINDQYPWLCVDSTNLYVVWQSWRNGTWKVYLTISSDGGTMWSAPDTVPGILVTNAFTSNINVGPQPKITVDNKSNPDTTFLYLLWADNATGLIQIQLARSIDSGQSFVDFGIVDNNFTNVNRNPYIVVDDSGWVHCAWAWGTGGTNQDPHPWIGYNRSQDRGNTFLPTDLIANDDSGGVYRGNPSLTYNASNGNVLISWEDSRRAGGNANPDIWFSRIHRDSLSFAPNQRVNWWGPDTSIRCDNFRPAIMMDPNGILVAAWHDDPETNENFGIHMAAYSDTIGRFSNSQSLINTFTGTSGASFGNDFYPPSLFVTLIDTITNFFLVWQDYYEDSLGGNIYSVRGWVVETYADLDVDNDSLGVENDTMNLEVQPAGPVYYYAKKPFVLANTDSLYNPDSEDGPSISPVDSLTYSSTLDSVFIIGLPSSLNVGEAVICTCAVVIAKGTPEGSFTGTVTIQGQDSLGALVEESFTVIVEGPRARGSLDSLRIAPIPFKPNSDPEHDAIHFQGLTANTTVRVYDLSGTLVFGPKTDKDGDGHLAWDAEVGSGIYIYFVKTSDGSEQKKGKLSVIR